jgi:ketosteroid isomerase-like protein
MRGSEGGLPNDYDNVAIVVDWLDACRSGNVDALLGLYAADAGLESAHEGIAVRGRAQLAAYWAARLATPAPGAFVLEQIMPVADGVMLDHSDAAGRLVRTTFSFAADGRISRSQSEPLPP